SLPSTDQNPKYFQTSLFRCLGVTITFSAAVKLDSALSASRKSTVSSDSARQCDSCDLSLISGARPPANQTVLPLFFFFFLHSNINFYIRNSIFNNYSNIYSNLEYYLHALVCSMRV